MRIKNGEANRAEQGNGEHQLVFRRFEEPEQHDVDEYQHNRVVEVNRVGYFTEVLKGLAVQHLGNDAGRACKNHNAYRENEWENEFPKVQFPVMHEIHRRDHKEQERDFECGKLKCSLF